MQNTTNFKLIAQSFFVLAITLYFLIALCLRMKKIEITYDIVFKLVFFIAFPIVAFPFLVLSDLSVKHKIYATIAALSLELFQFFATKLFRERVGKRSSKGDTEQQNQ